MAIYISLTPNHIAKDGTAIPRLVNTGRVSTEQLLDYMEKGTAIGRHDMETVFSRLAAALKFYMSMGSKVTTPIGIFSPAIRAGSLPMEATASELPKTSLRMNFLVNKPLMKAIRDDTEIKIAAQYHPQGPEIFGISPAGQEYLDSPLEQPALMNLFGWNLSFDPDDIEQGLFIFPAARPEDPGIRIGQYSRAGSNHIDFLIHGIPAGKYLLRLVLRTQKGSRRSCETSQVITLL
jgi:hypothetical protein